MAVSYTHLIARTCAATRSRLHLIKPLGFDISEKAVRRAGLDYWNMVDLQVYEMCIRDSQRAERRCRDETQQRLQ